jgi:hypothetical protein
MKILALIPLFLLIYCASNQSNSKPTWENLFGSNLLKSNYDITILNDNCKQIIDRFIYQEYNKTYKYHICGKNNDTDTMISIFYNLENKDTAILIYLNSKCEIFNKQVLIKDKSLPH